jgi:hypothetical protein
LPEQIFKLQPDRTVHLRGFDTFAAAACVHSASPTGFKVSGTFRDPADFAVAVLYDADNFYEHPSIKYLPDFDFSGLTLNFNLRYAGGLQPIDSPKYNWIDWATLDCIRADGTTAQVRLWDNATLVDPAFPAASATFNMVTSGDGVKAFDRVTLWYQNLAFDYVAPDGKANVTFQFFATGTGSAHSITVNGRTYSHTEIDAAGESSAVQAAALIRAMAGDPDVSASAGGASNAVILTVRPERAGVAIPVSGSDGNGSTTMRLSTPELAAAALVNAINADTDWITANTTHALLARNTGAQIRLTAARYGMVSVNGVSVTLASGHAFAGITPGSDIRIAGLLYTVASVQSPQHLTLSAVAPTSSGSMYVAARGGRDGNLIELYATSKTSTLGLDQTQIILSGGESDVTWNCKVDFTALGIDQLRQCWLTFAPALVNGPYPATEWEAIFSNWSVTGTEANRALSAAGPGSVRIEESDKGCVFTPAASWSDETGFYSKYFAKGTSDPAAQATITYTCQFTHDLYIGTSLYSDRAVAGIRVDGDTETSLDCRLQTGSAVVTRRRIRRNVTAGRHIVTITLQQPGAFYFDFLEAAVGFGFSDPLEPRTKISPALDFDTDHTYKLSPSRLMWIMDQLGYAGPMNEYLGVFWWNERVLSGGSLSTAVVSFTGTFTAGDKISLTLNGAGIDKTVFPEDINSTNNVIANHFAAYINGAFVGARASASGGTLTITGRSPAPAYNLDVTVATSSATGLVQITQHPVPGEYGTWVIDDAINPPLNRAARDWHADFYSQCASRNREVVTACSMELVNPPDGYAARFPDTARTPVSTATGFGTLVSNHCAVGSGKLLAYQKAVYRNIAQLQDAAGLTPNVQYGEFLWWYFSGPGGMACYDDETLAAAQAALGRPLRVFSGPDDNPLVNGGADAIFLRNRLRDYIAALVQDLRAAWPAAKCEVLWPYDVNYPTPVPDTSPYLGGQFNRFVNLPVEWQQKATSGLDRMKVEALAFSSGMRNLDLARQAIELFPSFGWPLASVRYLLPVFGSATPWNRELALAIGAGVATNNLWAFDHICLYNLDVPERGLERRSTVQAG